MITVDFDSSISSHNYRPGDNIKESTA